MFHRVLLTFIYLGFISLEGGSALAQSEPTDVSLESFNAQGSFLRHSDALAYMDPIATTLGSRDAHFRKVPGLADPKAVSFESFNFPNMYLRHRSGRLSVTACPSDGDKRDASFFVRPGLASDKDGWISLELFTHPGSFVRNKDGEVWTDTKKDDAAFSESATFRLVKAVVPTPKRPKGNKLLIVAPHRFEAVLARFVTHKNELLPTELVSLETVVKDTEGADDAEKLKRFIYNRWKTEKLGYVLMVGDAEVMPIRYSSITGKGRPGYGGWLFIPSDLYFANLAKKDGSFDDWNSTKNGYPPGFYAKIQGEEGQNPINIDRIGYVPDVAVGRWPVHTTAQVKTLVTKTIEYERHVIKDDVPAIRRVAFVNGPNYTDSRTAMTAWAQKLEEISKQKSIRLLYKDRTRDDGTPPPSELEVARALRAGVGLLLHIGHGGETNWDGCLDLGHLAWLSEAKFAPVMFSIGCETARFAPICPEMPYLDANGKAHPGVESKKERFDTAPPPPNPYQSKMFDRSSLGVELLRRGNKGAVAYIGCNVASQSNAGQLMAGFMDYVIEVPEPRLGDAWVAGVTEYYYDLRLATLKARDWVQLTTFHQAMKYQLFGDPSLRLPRSPLAK